MEQLIPILVQVIGGAAGGNVVGALLKNVDLNKVLATIVGIIGGVGGGQLASVMGVVEQIFGSDGGAGEIAGEGGAAAIGGAVLTAIVGFIKKSMNKPTA